ncbi:hypothetical protein DYB32_010211, partial [Aphanomyces invadans]
EICLTASSIFILSQGELEVLAWDDSATFFDGTSPKPPVNATNVDTLHAVRMGQAKKVPPPPSMLVLEQKEAMPDASLFPVGVVGIDWIAHYVTHHPNLHDDDIIVYTDAWDVVIQTDMSAVGSILRRMTGGQRGLLFNSEPSCGDSFELPGEYGEYLRSASFDVHLSVADKHVRSVTGRDICRQMLIKSSMHSAMGGPNWSLGSGGIVGDVWTFRQFMARVVQVTTEQIERARADPTVPVFEGDQISFQLAYLRSPELNVLVDTRSEVFLVTSFMTLPGAVDHYDIDHGCSATSFFRGGVPSKLRWFNHTPMILHFPGDYKHLYDRCADNVKAVLKAAAPGKFMWDVDRNTSIPVHDVCYDYT